MGEREHIKVITMNQNSELYFPSGLSISRAKKDAKKLKKQKNIPLNQALDEIAQGEMDLTWEQALRALSENINDHDESDEIIFSETISNSELIKFEKMIKENYEQPDAFIYPANSLYIDGNLWPSPLAVTYGNAEYFCDMLNKFSLRDFETGLIDTHLENTIGEESYDMWQDSNCPIYDPNNIEFNPIDEPNDKHVDSQQALFTQLEIIRDQLLRSEAEI